jgi:hypothetical protein
VFKTALGGKVHKTPSQQKNLSVVAHACIPAMAGSIKQEVAVPSQHGQKVRLYLQNTESQRGWRARCLLVAHTCNLSYSGGRDQEDRVSKPAWANS